MNDTEDLEKLAEECLEAAKTIKQYFNSNGLPQMSFDQNGPAAFPDGSHELQMARMKIRDTTRRLYHLTSGPDEVISQYLYNAAHDFNAFRYIHHFRVTREVPMNETISYTDLATKLNIDSGQLKQMIRQLIQIHVFQEPEPGKISHTAASKLLLNHGAGVYNAWLCEDTMSITTNQLEAIKKWGHGSQEPNQAAFNYAFQTDLPMYQYYEENPESRKRFSNLMTYVSNLETFSNKHVISGFDWKSLPPDTIVVDLAGNVGHSSIPIIQTNPKIKIIVQDLPLIISRAKDPSTCVVPSEYQDRIEFMVHDFYQPQPIIADIYFIRMILHDYSDKYAIKILKALLPALKPGAKLIIMDQIMPPVGVVPPSIERIMRTMDLQMLALTNAKERDMNEWIDLLEAVDSKLKIKNVITPPGSTMSVIEVVFDG